MKVYTVIAIDDKTEKKGGKRSGFRGHSGRPGKVGGSLPSGGGGVSRISSGTLKIIINNPDVNLED